MSMDKNIITIIVVALGLVAPISVLLFNRILKNYDEKIKGVRDLCDKQLENLRDSIKDLYQINRDHVKDYHKHEE